MSIETGPDVQLQLVEMIERIAAIGVGTVHDPLPTSNEGGLLNDLALAVNGLARQLRESEAERVTQNRNFRVILKNAHAVIFMIDNDGIFQLSEGHSLAALGLEPGEAVGQSAFEMYAEFPNAIRGIKAALAGKNFSDVIDINGVIFDIFYSPYHRSDGSIGGALGMAIDITELKRAENEREDLQQMLQQSQKLEAIGRLAGGVAHDFNNLLTTISGNVILARMAQNDPTRIREHLAEIEAASRRAADLTRQLLAFSSRQVSEQRVLLLSELIEPMQRMLKRLIGEDIELKTSHAPEQAAVRVDQAQIEQVLVNLVLNSRDAMPDGGLLTVSTSNIRLNAEQVRKLNGQRPGDYVVLEVSDTGSGMTPETAKHAFEPFFTTKPFGMGTGLGLSLVYGTVRQHGGLIDVRSTPDQETTFRAYFPVVAEQPDLPATATPLGSTAYGAETILLVEDEATVRDLVQQVLRHWGYHVLVASEATLAFELAARYKVKLLVTDVVMPGMKGGELAQRLNAKDPGLRVLFISGYADDVIVQHGVIRGSANYLAKPFTPQQLVDKVREVLDAEPQEIQVL